MTTYTVLTDASIGFDSIYQGLTDAIGIDADEVIARADRLFDADPRTVRLVWRPELSEIWTVDLDEDDESDFYPEDFDPVGFIQDCLRQAFEEACCA